MTLDELKNKRIILAVSGKTSFSLDEDLSDETLQDILDTQEDNVFTDEELLDYIIDTYYDTDDFVGNYADDYLQSEVEYEMHFE